MPGFSKAALDKSAANLPANLARAVNQAAKQHKSPGGQDKPKA